MMLEKYTNEKQIKECEWVKDWNEWMMNENGNKCTQNKSFFVAFTVVCLRFFIAFSSITKASKCTKTDCYRQNLTVQKKNKIKKQKNMKTLTFQFHHSKNFDAVANAYLTLNYQTIARIFVFALINVPSEVTCAPVDYQYNASAAALWKGENPLKRFKT